MQSRFRVYQLQQSYDDAMKETAESVKEYGVLTPAIVWPREAGGYEIVAGHRRKHACELAGLAALPALVRNLDDDTATILMVDSNIQRENILPSERAQAYKIKLEAIKRHAGRRTKEAENNSPNYSANFRSDDEIGAAMGMSGDTVRNYISLTQLIPELQQMVDDKKIAVTPAYPIAALKPEEQALLVETIESEQATPFLCVGHDFLLLRYGKNRAVLCPGICGARISTGAVFVPAAGIGSAGCVAGRTSGTGAGVGGFVLCQVQG